MTNRNLFANLLVKITVERGMKLGAETRNHRWREKVTATTATNPEAREVSFAVFSTERSPSIDLRTNWR